MMTWSGKSRLLQAPKKRLTFSAELGDNVCVLSSLLFYSVSFLTNHNSNGVLILE
jgi:hypothetical protein